MGDRLENSNDQNRGRLIVQSILAIPVAVLTQLITIMVLGLLFGPFNRELNILPRGIVEFIVVATATPIGVYGSRIALDSWLPHYSVGWLRWSLIFLYFSALVAHLLFIPIGWDKFNSYWQIIVGVISCYMVYAHQQGWQSS